MPQMLKILPRTLMLVTLATVGAVTLSACDEQGQQNKSQPAPPPGGGGGAGGTR